LLEHVNVFGYSFGMVAKAALIYSSSFGLHYWHDRCRPVQIL
jgi:exopolysaccharide production protein ExoZ